MGRSLLRSSLLAIALFVAACGSSDETTGAADPAPTTTVVTTTTVDEPADTGPEPTTTTVVDESPLLPPGETIPRSSGEFDEVLDREAAPVPVTIRVGDLEIDAPVVPVGVEPDGLMEIPGASEVGWYRYGPTAGQAGSTVLAAHVDFNGQRGVFFDLQDLQPGAVVEVELDDGSIRRYEIVDNARYLKDDLPLDDVFRRDGDEVLTLITCGGAFDAVSRSYEDNVVAVAVPIP
ncbi:MAG: class F sortase [Actinomycetota bacterium]